MTLVLVCYKNSQVWLLRERFEVCERLLYDNRYATINVNTGRSFSLYFLIFPRKIWLVKMVFGMENWTLRASL